MNNDVSILIERDKLGVLKNIIDDILIDGWKFNNIPDDKFSVLLSMHIQVESLMGRKDENGSDKS